MLADALFRLTLDARFHRSGATQVDVVPYLVVSLQVCREEMYQRATIISDDWVYGKASFIDLITEIIICSRIFIMPKHLVSMHPIVRQSHMDSANDDLLEGQTYESDGREPDITAEHEDVALIEVAGNASGMTAWKGTAGQVWDNLLLHNLLYQMPETMVCLSIVRREEERLSETYAVAHVPF